MKASASLDHCSQKHTRITEEQRVDASHEVPAGAIGSDAILAAQMAFDHVIRHRDEGLARALAALDLGLAGITRGITWCAQLAAHAPDPLVRARRRVA